jgi:hypothetical protein
MGLIQSQVKDGPPSHVRTSRVYGGSPFRHLQGAFGRDEVLLTQLRGGRSLLLRETRKKVGLYLTMLWGGGGGLGASPADVPKIGEPKEKELCAGPPATLGYDNGPGGCGTVLPGGLQLGPPVIVFCHHNNNNPEVSNKFQIV